MNTCLVFSASFVLTIIVESQGNLRCKSVEGFLVQEQSVSFTEVLGLHTCTLVTQHPIEIQSAISANQLTDSHSFLIVELMGMCTTTVSSQLDVLIAGLFNYVDVMNISIRILG